MPKFIVETITGRTYAEGDPNPYAPGDPGATLASIDADEAYLALRYGDGTEISIPNCRIERVVEHGTAA